jgi:hypothetical protein
MYRDPNTLEPNEAICRPGRTKLGNYSCRKTPVGRNKRLVGVESGSQCVINKGRCKYSEHLNHTDSNAYYNANSNTHYDDDDSEPLAQSMFYHPDLDE